MTDAKKAAKRGAKAPKGKPATAASPKKAPAGRSKTEVPPMKARAGKPPAAAPPKKARAGKSFAEAPPKKAAAGQAAADAPPKDAAEAPASWGSDRGQQVGQLLSRSLDLAEAGLTLGVSLMNKVGAAAQKQILERFMSGAAAMVDAGMAQAQAPAPEPPPPGGEAGGPDPGTFGITNRMPLLPGAQFHVGFSINNDSMESPKKLALSIEGFVGETHGHPLDADLAVKPGRKTIAPMDFEKFVLEGTVPPKTLPDIYRGWIIVHSDTDMRIPAWLSVSSM